MDSIRYAVRRLIHRPLVTITILTTIAIGVGASTAVFSVLDALLLRPLPFHDPDRLVQVWKAYPSGGMVASTPDEFRQWRAQSDLFSPVEGFGGGIMVLTGADEPRMLAVTSITGDMMSLLGAESGVALGRAIGPDDARPGFDDVIVLSDPLWRSQFGADRTVLGRAIRLNDRPYTVIGVMAPAFQFPRPGTDAWTPLPIVEPVAGGSRVSFSVLARLAPGVTIGQAQERLDALAPGWVTAGTFPKENKPLVTGFSDHRLDPGPRQAVWTIFGAVSLVLLIACANVANLLLAQGAARERELAVRAAIGASRWRLVSELAVESVLLALAGGAGGVVLAIWGVEVLTSLAPATLTASSLNPIAIDGRVLAFSLAVTLGSGALFGMAPSLRAARRDVHEPLKSAGRTARVPLIHGRLGRGLVVAEMAFSVVLLLGAGLLIRTFIHVTNVDPGFDPTRLLAIRLQVPPGRIGGREALQQFYSQVVDRVRAVPGVAGATAGSNLPPAETVIFMIDVRIEAEGEQAVLEDPGVLPQGLIDPEYFSVTGIPLLSGRPFSRDDLAQAQKVIIINEGMARRVWRGGDPVGRRVRLGRSPEADWLTVVGVSGNVYQFSAAMDRDAMHVYVPTQQASAWSRYRTLVVRAEGDPAPLIPAVKSAIWTLDPDLPIQQVETGASAYDKFFAPARFNATLLTVFAAIGVLLAAIGLYGLMAFTVAERTPEFGVRLAVGAEPRDIASLVLGRGVRLAVAGGVLGLIAAGLASRAIDKLLIGIAPGDPISLAIVVLGLFAVTLLACWLPVRHALRINPVEALRHE